MPDKTSDLMPYKPLFINYNISGYKLATFISYTKPYHSSGEQIQRETN